MKAENGRWGALPIADYGAAPFICFDHRSEKATKRVGRKKKTTREETRSAAHRGPICIDILARRRLVNAAHMRPGEAGAELTPAGSGEGFHCDHSERARG